MAHLRVHVGLRMGIAMFKTSKLGYNPYNYGYLMLFKPL